MRKILVPIKRVPDYQASIKLLPDGSGIQTEGVKWILNPFDEIAVEEALRIKESQSKEAQSKETQSDVEVVVISIGPQGTTEQVRTALAMGADQGILVVTNQYIDSDTAHRILAEMYRKDSYQLIIMGKQAIDSDCNQTGQLLAANLNVPQATFASKLVIDPSWGSATVTREVDGGLETIQVDLPAVVTTDLRLNEPRYPSLPGIVKAKKKPLAEIQLSDLGIDATPKIKIRRLELPQKRKGGTKVGSVQELVMKLKDEAKVI